MVSERNEKWTKAKLNWTERDWTGQDSGIQNIIFDWNGLRSGGSITRNWRAIKCQRPWISAHENTINLKSMSRSIFGRIDRKSLRANNKITKSSKSNLSALFVSKFIPMCRCKAANLYTISIRILHFSFRWEIVFYTGK